MSENPKNDVKAPAPAPAVAAPPAPTLAAAAEVRVPPKTMNFAASRRVLPDVIEAALGRGIRVVLTQAGYEFDGFYRWGPMRVEPDPKTGTLLAIDRKEVVVPIASFDELVKLNYACWKKSRDKSAKFVNPGKEWQSEFERLNLVKRQVVFIPGDE